MSSKQEIHDAILSARKLWVLAHAECRSGNLAGVHRPVTNSHSLFFRRWTLLDTFPLKVSTVIKSEDSDSPPSQLSNTHFSQPITITSNFP